MSMSGTLLIQPGKRLGPISLAIVAWMLAGCATERTDSPAESRNPYHEPLTSPGAKFAALPPSVRNTVRAQAGGAPIADIVRSDLPNGTVYQIRFENPLLWPPLHVAADGSVLYPNLAVAVGAAAEAPEVIAGRAGGGPPGGLPELVMKAVRDREPHGAIENITSETWGNRVIYHITFKNPARSPGLFVTGDGIILQDYQGGKAYGP
jgi:hypothetical protein